MTSATDIISYIGIPLAVLGTTPVLYTSSRAMLTLSSVRRSLATNGINAITRTSLISGLVEVELPRCSITPLDRDDPEYWTLNPRPSTLKGGSWTLFNWNRIVTAQRLYRVQYHEDLHEPQAEVNFEELLALMLDRGAIPDSKGMKMLRLTGLWTPVGTTLLLAPDCSKSALRVAVPDDSDGVLSLVMDWRKEWDQKDEESLPPSWMRVRNHDVETGSNMSEGIQVTEKEASPEDTEAGSTLVLEEKKISARDNDAELNHDKEDQRLSTIRFLLGIRAGSLYVNSTHYETRNNDLSPGPSVAHLCESPASIWFSSAAIALGQLQGMALWTLHIPGTVTTLASKDCLPCEVLCMLGLIDEKDAPTWATQYDPGESINEHHNRFVRKMQAESAERQMPPAVAEAARRARQQAELTEMGQEFRAKMRRERERAEKREMEAVGSSRMETVVATQAAFLHLKSQSGFGGCSDVQQTAEKILFEMLTEPEKSEEVCGVLERWKLWTERGGMNREDLKAIMDSPLTFCRATCLMGLLRMAAGKDESSVALDMQECIRVWKKVRLG